MAIKNKRPQNKRGATSKNNNRRTDFNTTSNQRNRILKRLEQSSCSTVDLRHQEDILGVAPRIYELRHHHGCNIQTIWVQAYNPGGGKHKVALYTLLPGKWQGGGYAE